MTLIFDKTTVMSSKFAKKKKKFFYTQGEATHWPLADFVSAFVNLIEIIHEQKCSELNWKLYRSVPNHINWRLKN